jgi:hypothetical protein
VAVSPESLWFVGPAYAPAGVRFAVKDHDQSLLAIGTQFEPVVPPAALNISVLVKASVTAIWAILFEIWSPGESANRRPE